MNKLIKLASYTGMGILSISAGLTLGMLLTSFQNSHKQLPATVLTSPNSLVRKLDSIEFYIKEKYKYKQPKQNGTLYTNLQ